MGHEIAQEHAKNHETFRECLASTLIERISRQPTKPKPKRRSRRGKKPGDTPPAPVPDVASAVPSPVEEPSQSSAAEDLAEFIEYIATETFPSLPLELQSLAYHDLPPDLGSKYRLPLTTGDTEALLPTLPPSVPDSLEAYGMTTPDQDHFSLLAPVLTQYITQASAAPPPPRQTRKDVDGCEICGRDWINLTYHHLIPRFVHAKVLKRGWHRKDELENVAWLCGACHRFVHRFADHETLAREFYTVERLLEEEEVRVWAEWVGRLRWKGS